MKICFVFFWMKVFLNIKVKNECTRMHVDIFWIPLDESCRRHEERQSCLRQPPRCAPGRSPIYAHCSSPSKWESFTCAAAHTHIHTLRARSRPSDVKELLLLAGREDIRCNNYAVAKMSPFACLHNIKTLKNIKIYKNILKIFNFKQKKINF